MLESRWTWGRPTAALRSLARKASRCRLRTAWLSHGRLQHAKPDPVVELRHAGPVVGVENRREDAWRVEAQAAFPVERPIGTDERDGVQIADQAMLAIGR